MHAATRRTHRPGVLSLAAMSSYDARKADEIRVTFTGADRLGITAELTSVLDDAGVTLLDVEQVVVQGRLNLNFLLALPGGDAAARPVLKEVLWKARELGLSVDYDLAPTQPSASPTPMWALTVLANPVDTGLLARIARTTQRTGFNIERIQRLSHRALTSVEFLLSGPTGECERALRSRPDGAARRALVRSGPAAREAHAPQQAADRHGHGLHADPAGGHRRDRRRARRAGRGQRHHGARHERRARLRPEPARARAAAQGHPREHADQGARAHRADARRRGSGARAQAPRLSHGRDLGRLHRGGRAHSEAARPRLRLRQPARGQGRPAHRRGARHHHQPASARPSCSSRSPRPSASSSTR